MSKPLALLVTGSRSVPVTEWEDIVNDALDREMRQDAPYLTILHGMCPHPGFTDGAWMASIDMLADEWAVQNQVNVLRFPADWNGPLGKGAGPARNRLMVDTINGMMQGGWRVSAHAFHPMLTYKGGTAHCVRYAMQHGLYPNLHDGRRIWMLGLENPPYFS